MKIIFTALAITALSTTLAFAQTAVTTGTTATTDTTAPVTAAATTDTTNSTSSTGSQAKTMSKDSCMALMGKIHTSADINWSDSESKPYLEKMSTMKMSTKTEGKLTSDDFMTACQAGAFQAMN